MITATFVRHVRTGGKQLYRLSEPVKYGWGKDRSTRYVVVSAAHVLGEVETYIFPSDSTGHILDWLEMPGSTKGTLSHETAIRNAGWVLN